MSIDYSAIEIFTDEEARYQGKPLYKAIISRVSKLKIAARCIVTKGMEGCYENGQIATQDILIMSYNLPIKIELLLPSSELNLVLPMMEEMVVDGIVTVRKLDIYHHKIRKYLIPRHIRVRDMMTPSPETVMPSTPLSDVVKLLLSAVFTGVPVVDPGGHPKGMISQSDLLYRAELPMRLGILAEFEKDKFNEFLKTLALRNAEEIMTRPVIAIQKDELLTKAVSEMIVNKVKRLVVVDKSEQVVGMLSRIDIFRGITRESPDWNAFRQKKIGLSNIQFVSDIMRRDTFSVLPDASVEDIIQLTDTRDIQCIAVVDTDGRLAGLIYHRDLLGIFCDQKFSVWDCFTNKIPFSTRGRKYKGVVKNLIKKTAAEVMQTDLTTVLENTDIDIAITVMVTKKIKQLPVLDSNGKFKGLINRESLLQATLNKA